MQNGYTAQEEQTLRAVSRVVSPDEQMAREWIASLKAQIAMLQRRYGIEPSKFCPNCRKPIT